MQPYLGLRFHSFMMQYPALRASVAAMAIVLPLLYVSHPAIGWHCIICTGVRTKFPLDTAYIDTKD